MAHTTVCQGAVSLAGMQMFSDKELGNNLSIAALNSLSSGELRRRPPPEHGIETNSF